MNPDAIKVLIERGLPGADAMVESDDNTHFAARVIAPQFEGKRTLQRHQLVYATLGDLMGREIHALSLQTLTAAEAGR
jgi:acid stress-induced BolA-like protein IbaG/YrbA